MSALSQTDVEYIMDKDASEYTIPVESRPMGKIIEIASDPRFRDAARPMGEVIEIADDPRFRNAEQIIDEQLASIAAEEEGDDLTSARASINECFVRPEPISPEVKVQSGLDVLRGVYSNGKKIVDIRNYSLAENPLGLPDDEGKVMKRLANTVLKGVLKPRTKEQLINEEAAEFSPIIFGHERKDVVFFCQDENNWMGCFESRDPKTGAIQIVMYHFELLQNGILKCSSEDNMPNKYISGIKTDEEASKEARDFQKATEAYKELALKKYNPGAYSDKIAA